MKTRNLTGRALDYAVAVAEGMNPHVFVEPDFGQQRPREIHIGINVEPSGHDIYSPTTSPDGDDIIDRERISTEIGHSGQWLAYLMYNLNDDKHHMVVGTTRREAAMRCYVASKLGDEVEIPKELQ